MRWQLTRRIFPGAAAFTEADCRHRERRKTTRSRPSPAPHSPKEPRWNACVRHQARQGRLRGAPCPNFDPSLHVRVISASPSRLTRPSPARTTNTSSRRPLRPTRSAADDCADCALRGPTLIGSRRHQRQRAKTHDPSQHYRPHRRSSRPMQRPTRARAPSGPLIALYRAGSRRARCSAYPRKARRRGRLTTRQNGRRTRTFGCPPPRCPGPDTR